MKKDKSFGIFTDLWDDDDVTCSITWGLCGHHPRLAPPGKQAPGRPQSQNKVK